MGQKSSKRKQNTSIASSSQNDSVPAPQYEAKDDAESMFSIASHVTHSTVVDKLREAIPVNLSDPVLGIIADYYPGNFIIVEAATSHTEVGEHKDEVYLSLQYPPPPHYVPFASTPSAPYRFHATPPIPPSTRLVPYAIHVIANSHDQGWSSSGGTYSNTWGELLFCDSRRWRVPGRENRAEAFRNVNNHLWQRHEKYILVDHLPKVKIDPHDWSLNLLIRSAYPAWQIHINYAKLRVLCHAIHEKHFDEIPLSSLFPLSLLKGSVQLVKCEYGAPGHKFWEVTSVLSEFIKHATASFELSVLEQIKPDPLAGKQKQHYVENGGQIYLSRYKERMPVTVDVNSLDVEIEGVYVPRSLPDWFCLSKCHVQQGSIIITSIRLFGGSTIGGGWYNRLFVDQLPDIVKYCRFTFVDAFGLECNQQVQEWAFEDEHSAELNPPLMLETKLQHD